MNETAAQSETPRRGRRRLWASCGVLVAVILLIGVALALLTGRQISAPEWLRQEIATRVNAQLMGAEVAFGEVSVIIARDGIPRVSLRNVALNDAEGARLATLSDITGTLALRPLLRGEVQPGAITLSGATLRLRRAEDGALGVALGDSPRMAEEAVGFTALIGQLDAVLMQPGLRDLHDVRAENLTIQYEDARARQGWTVDGGRLHLSREGEDLQIRGDFALLGNRGYATTLEMNYQGRIGDTAAELGISFADMPARDIARQSPALAWLDALDAPISGALRVAVEEAGSLGALNATLQIGAGAVQPTEATRPVPFSGAHAYFTYDPATQSLNLNDVFVDSKWGTARAEGKAFLVGMDQGLPSEIWAQIRLSELRANPAGLYREPVVFEGATMDVRLALDPFTLSLGEMSLADQGQRLILSGEVAARPEGWGLAIDGRMDALAPERLIALWPERFQDKTRTWLRENVAHASLRHIQLALRASPQHKPKVFLQFDYSDLETRFMKAMPPIEAAHGQGTLYDNRLALAVAGGHVTAPQGGQVAIAGSRFVIPDVSVKQAPAEIGLRARSTVTAALALLDHEPFGFLGKAGLPVTLADGQLEVAGRLDLQLKDKLAFEDVTFDAQGIARQVRSDTLVPGRTLAAPEVTVQARHDALEIAGTGRIGQVPAAATWQTALGRAADGRSTLTGTVELSERFTDEFNIGLPPQSVSGAGEAEIRIDFAKGQPAQFDLSSDLAGLGLRLAPLGWSLDRRATGRLEVAGRLGSPAEITAIALSGAGLAAEGAMTLTPDGQLDVARFSRVTMGDWLDVPVDLVGRGAGQTPAVRVTGGRVDLRQTSLTGSAEGSEGARRGQGGPLSLALEVLRLSDGIDLTGFRAELDTSQGLDGTFSATVNGGAEITGRVVPQAGRNAFRILAQDAGGVLRSAGMLRNARGGQMDLILRPGAARGSYDGTLDVTALRIIDAPSLAALLSALSVVGLLEQLSGEGIVFNEVEAEFQMTPDRVTLTRGSAVGASMGLSMEGYYFLERGEMEMQGVFSPLYVLNSVGEMFTRKGEGLIGFNYWLSGPVANPQVSVNPLSLLTPGMFREVFRGEPPRTDGTPQPAADPPETPDAAAPVQQPRAQR